MNPRHAELIELFLDESIKAGDLEELLLLIQQNEFIKHQLAAAARMHGLIVGAGHPDADCEELTHVVMKGLGRDAEGASFESRVMDKIPRRGRKGRRRRSRRNSLWPAWAAAAIILIAVGFFMFSGSGTDPDPARIRADMTECDHSVRLIRNDIGMPAEPGLPVQLGDRISGNSGSITYRSDKARLELRGRTRFRLNEEDLQSRRIDLQEGSLGCRLPRPAGKPLAIHTTEAIAMTPDSSAFQVEAFPGWTTLQVEEGEVNFTRREDNASIKVDKDHYAVAGLDIEFAPIPIMPEFTSAPGPEKTHDTPGPAVPAQSPKLVGFTLINAETDLPVPGFDPIPDGAVIDREALGLTHINIRANTSPPVTGNVRFDLNGKKRYKIEVVAPYAIGQDENGNYRSWSIPPGRHTLTGIPFTGRAGLGSIREKGMQGESLTISFVLK